MLAVTASQLAQLLGATLAGDAGAQVTRVAVDSRAPLGPGTLFIGLRGPRFDGGQFAAAALDAGCAAVMVSGGVVATPAERESPVPGLPGSVRPGQAVLSVSDTTHALQELAGWHRQQCAAAVWAVTGSNGKTLTKDLLWQMLAPSRRTFATPGSWNSQVGVPLSLLRMESADELALVECGISLPGEMERLRQIVRPDAGIFTNLGDAHLSNFPSALALAAEKAALFVGLPPGAPVVCGSDACEQAVRLVNPECRIVRPMESERLLVLQHLDASVRADAGLVADAMLAVVAARLLGAPESDVVLALEHWTPAPMRMEIITTPAGVMLLNDAYTSDRVSLENALRTLHAERSGGRTMAVLSGLGALGDRERAELLEIANALKSESPDVLVGVGAGGAALVEAMRAAGSSSVLQLVSSPAEAALAVDEWARAGDRVLLKGSRAAGLDRVVQQMGGRPTSARVLVDLDRIVGNFFAVRRAVGPGVGIMPVIKAFGYGLDAARLARELQRAGAEHFCVAYANEGVVLRQRGIVVPILVQNVLPGDEGTLLEYRLAAVVGSQERLEALAAAAGRGRDVLEVHLKVDTGMGRAGALADELASFFARAASMDALRVTGLMTHFASSEDRGRDAFTLQQIARFDDAIALARSAGLNPRWIHACNSSAVSRFPQAHYTMVRAGIGLFGLAEGASAELGQQAALTLEARVIEVKSIPPGWPVGYGSRWHAGTEGATVAVVSVGYNDGYPRALSGLGWMRVRGVRCPVVGSVCMDVSMLDVSNVPGVTPGDTVTVYSPEEEGPTVEEMARLAGTIPYELLTRLSGRVRRVHLKTT
jgi:alanine racemase